ncbi:hypothetical protein [Puia dinghuensis]|uniref:Lipoprotein n=1 Tax=Puia dinghuensis TaxID=1792502 RepID=A0A8J2UFM0_9BACT|nr:hypothetical protein [Puia dinghuensis]GGB10646.1 hypothetical protein GCM10011511_37780 [Puia dinghuensis]
MKKTSCIKLVLITAALAACNKPIYQQGSYLPDYYPSDPPDSTNSCPIDYPQLLPDFSPDYYTWLYGFRPYHHHHRAGVSRAGFGGGGHTISS